MWTRTLHRLSSACTRSSSSSLAVAYQRTSTSTTTWFMSSLQRRHKSCAIVGLPNVGKSTLFNALTQTQAAQAENYPFCTIEPNIAMVAVPDPRLNALAKITQSKRIISTQLQFVDVAGLIRGAHKGEGLGNQFLQNIRDCSVIMHVLRCFDKQDIVHVHSQVDPIGDMEVIETELLLADLQNVEKRIATAEKRAQSRDAKDSSAKVRHAALTKCKTALENGISVIDVLWTEEEWRELELLQLLTAKHVAYVCNVDEASAAQGNSWSEAVAAHVNSSNANITATTQHGLQLKRKPRRCMRISAVLEAEAAASFDTPEARTEYLSSYNLTTTSLDQVVRISGELLDIQCFYTLGPEEARSWTINRGSTAPQAAGKIHSDMEKGFINCDVMKPEDYIQYNGEDGVKAAGKFMVEGKSYIVQDGDILLFRFQKPQKS